MAEKFVAEILNTKLDMEKASDNWDNVCPLCAEEMDLTDKQLKPCQCGYEICVWCWHHIMDMAEKDRRCPACREPYDKEKIIGMSVSRERLTDINFEKKHKSHKSKAKVAESRKHLSDVRVIQRNLVYVVGIPPSLANEKNLERREFFGQYGKILKVSISCSSSHSAQHSSIGTMSRVYITFMKEEDALRCIQAVNGYILEGQPLRACFGTTKYCYAWLKNMPCNNPDCLYLHDVGAEEDSFTKEELASKCGRFENISKTQGLYDITNSSQHRWGLSLPPPAAEVSTHGSTSSSKLSKPVAPNTGCNAKTALASRTTGRSVALPANASWGNYAAQEKLLPMRIPAVQRSPDPKLTSSHSLSVSPILSLPSLVVEAAASGLSSDHGKQLVSKGGQSSLFISEKHIEGRDDATSSTEIKSTSYTETSAAIETANCTYGEDFHRNDSSLNSLTMKCETPEGFQSLLKNSSLDSHKGSSELGNGPIETARSERTDAASVPSGIVCNGLPKDSFPISAPPSNTETNIHDVNKSCIVLSENHVNICSERSPFELRDKLEIKSSKDARYRTSYEKHYAEPYSEVCSKAIASETEVLSSMDEVQIPGDDYSSKDSSLHQMSLNTAILNGDCDSIGDTDYKVDEKSISLAEKISSGSIQILENESTIDAVDRSTATGFQMPEEVDIVRNSHASCGKLECLEKLGCNILPEVDMNDSDGGENSIISNILSLNFDTDDTSLNSPHSLAKLLLSETDKCNGLPKEISSSWKSQNSKQSRFLFARSKDSTERSSDHSTPNLATSRELQGELANEKDVLGSSNQHDQLKINAPSNTTFTANMQGFQSISEGSTFLIPSEAVVMHPSVSRTPHSAPPGFSIPNKVHSIPPPGFFLETKTERAAECGMSAVSDNQGEACENSVSLSNMAWSVCSQPCTPRNDNGVQFFDPAIMAVGKEKLSLGTSCPGRAISDSNSVGNQQSASNVNGSHALFEFGQPFGQKVSSVDYGGRLELLNQRAFYTNSYLAPSRQQLMYPDHVGDAFTSYMSSKKDAILPSRLLEPTQTNLNSQFSQVPFQHHANAFFRSPHEPNGWNNWSILSSGVEPQLVTGRSEPSLVEITNNERYGRVDPRFGPMKMFSNSFCDDTKFNKPSLGDLYSQIYM